MGKYTVKIEKQAKKDIEKQFKIGNKATVAKMIKIIDELRIHPKTGEGNPETLKGDLKGFYSRRLNQKDRIVYNINELIVTVFIVSAIGHYNDK